MNEPFLECPRFAQCSANRCPLDPLLDERDKVPGDETCGSRRSTREAIAARYADLLPAGGLLPREIRADKRRAAWEALPEEEKARRLANLKPITAEDRAKRGQAAASI